MGASNSSDNLSPPSDGSPAVEGFGTDMAGKDDYSDAGNSQVSEGSRAGSCRRLARFVFGGGLEDKDPPLTRARECRPGTCNIAGPRLTASDYECIERLERAGQMHRAARLRQSRQTLTAPVRRSGSSIRSDASGDSNQKTKLAPSQFALARESVTQKPERPKDVDATQITVQQNTLDESVDGLLSIPVAMPLASVVPSSGDDRSEKASSMELGQLLDDMGAPVYTNDSEQTSRGFIWNASRILLYYLQSPQLASSFSGKRVLEFGSGLGHLGYGLARLGAHVTCSEHRGAFPLLKVNIADLEAQHGTAAEKGGSLRAVELNWGEGGYRESQLSEEMESGAASFDVLISAELIWLDDLHDDLIWSWRRFCAAHTVVYSVYITRPLSWCFFEKLGALNEFEVEELRVGVDFHPCKLGEQLPVHVHRVTRRQTQMEMLPLEPPVRSREAAAKGVATTSDHASEPEAAHVSTEMNHLSI